MKVLGLDCINSEFIELFIDWLKFFVNFVCESGEVQQVEWSKIQTPTDEVVVPFWTRCCFEA
jgi:hypothetical protein